LLVEPKDEPVPCHTLNGNCVLVPREVATVVGNLDSAFIHAMGDIDYGLRARAAGYELWVMPGYAGTCAGNPSVGTYRDAKLALSERWKKMQSPKGLPFSQWKLMTQRHAGAFWFLYWLMPYARILLSPRFKK
jgi:GT2 family glycosyltransferase